MLYRGHLVLVNAVDCIASISDVNVVRTLRPEDSAIGDRKYAQRPAPYDEAAAGPNRDGAASNHHGSARFKEVSP